MNRMYVIKPLLVSGVIYKPFATHDGIMACKSFQDYDIRRLCKGNQRSPVVSATQGY